MTPASDEPTAQAQAIMERVLGLVRECRVVLRALEHSGEPGESSSAEAERVLYFTLVSAIDAGSYGRWRMPFRCSVTQANRWGRWVRIGWTVRIGR